MKKVVFNDNNTIFHLDCASDKYYIAVKDGMFYQLFHNGDNWIWLDLVRMGWSYSKHNNFRQVQQNMHLFKTVYQFTSYRGLVTWLNENIPYSVDEANELLNGDKK